MRLHWYQLFFDLITKFVLSTVQCWAIVHNDIYDSQLELVTYCDQDTINSLRNVPIYNLNVQTIKITYIQVSKAY